MKRSNQIPLFWLSALCFLLLCGMSLPVFAQTFTVFDVNAKKFPLLSAKFYILTSDGKQIAPSAQDFSVTENGKLRKTLSIQCPSNKEPDRISSVLTIDVSGSMAGGSPQSNIELAKAAAELWVHSMPLGYSECAVTSFDGFGYINQDFTTDKTKLLSAISLLKPQGGTVYDAGLKGTPNGGIEVAKRGKYKKVVVFLTDGMGSGDEAGNIQAALAGGVTVYCVGIRLGLPAMLKNLATKTGGMWFDGIESKEGAEAVYRNILQFAQNLEPCTVEWESTPDCQTARNVAFSYLPQNLSDSGQYFAPDSTVPDLYFSPQSIRFGIIQPGKTDTRQISMQAKNLPITVSAISSSNPVFLVKNVPTPFTLQPNEIKVMDVEFAPSDSNYAYTRIEVLSDGCSQSPLFADGGNPAKRANATIRVLSPNGGEKLVVGENAVLAWDGVLPSDTVRLDYSTNGGASWRLITTSATGMKYSWKVPNTPSSACLLRARQYITNMTPNGGNDQILDFWGHKNEVNSATFSPDASRLLTASDDGTAVVWDVENQTRLLTISVPNKALHASFNFDGTRIVVACADNTATVWSEQGTKILTLAGHSGNVNSAIFTPDSKYILTASKDNSIKIWDYSSGMLLSTLNGHSKPVMSVRSRADGAKIVSASADGTAIIWDMATFTQDKILTGHSNEVRSAVFSQDGANVLTASADLTMKIWNSATGGLIKTIVKAASPAYRSADFSPENARIVSGDEGQAVKIWDIASGSPTRIRGYGGEVNSVEFSFDGYSIAIASKDKYAGIWRYGMPTFQQDSSDNVWEIIAPEIASDDVNMGEWFVGGGSKDSVITAFIRNLGTAPLRVEKIGIKGANAADFTIISGQGEYVVPAGARHAVEIGFAPTALGKRLAQIEITTPIGVKTQTLEGVGIRRNLEVRSVDFGEVPVGMPKDTSMTVLVKNIGNEIVTVTTVMLAGPDNKQFFILRGNQSFTLLPDSSHAMDLEFLPTEIGRTSGRIAFDYGKTGTPIMAQLYGEGIAAHSTGIATLEVPNISAKPGETVEIPVFLRNAQNLQAAGVSGFTVNLRYNSSLLEPIDGTPQGILIGHERSIPLDLPSTATANSVLRSLRFRAMLGSDTSTALVLENATAKSGNATMTQISGRFSLAGLCYEGGTRLFDGSTYIGIAEISPNPGSGETLVRIETAERARTKLFVVNFLGQIVQVLADEEIATGEHRYILRADEVPAGIYIVVLQTPTVRKTATILIR